MSTCEGEFKIVAVDGDIRLKWNEVRCSNDAEWRVTYFTDTGMPAVNVCERCIMTASVLSLMYSAVRLEKNK